MTIIAYVAPLGVPCLVGDLLISGAQDPRKEVSVPGMGPITDFFGESGYGPVGLKQKLVTISNCCVLGWAGSFLGARTAIADLRDVAQREVLTAKRVFHFLNDHADALHHDCSFVGMVLEPTGSISNFGVRAWKTDLRDLGPHCIVAGSGAQFVADSMRWEHSEGGDLNVPRELRAFARVQRHVGQLLGMEVNAGYSAETIWRLFGGGYEVAVPQPGGVVKIPELTTLVWKRAQTAAGFRLEYMVKQIYDRDYLILKSALADEDGRFSQRVDIISPMYSTDYPAPRFEDWRALDFQSGLVSHHLIAETGAAFRVHSRLDSQGPGAAFLRIRDRPDGGFLIDLGEGVVRQFQAWLQH